MASEPRPPHFLSAITSAKAMSSSPSVAAPVPDAAVPWGLISQFMRPSDWIQSCSYFHRLSNRFWSSRKTAAIMP